jgi:hypothetical protein
MKMTLKIPDTILRQAKSAATKRGIPLCQFVTEAVREKLEARLGSADKPWMKSFGKLRHLHKESASITGSLKTNSSRGGSLTFPAEHGKRHGTRLVFLEVGSCGCNRLMERLVRGTGCQAI